MKIHKIFTLIFLGQIILVIILLQFRDLNLLLPTEPLRFHSRKVILILSLLLSIIAIFIFHGKWKFIHLFWLFPSFYLVLLFCINSWSYRNLDYLVGIKKEFRVEQHFEEKWIVNYIIIENKDTIFFSQNLGWIDKIDEELLTGENLNRLEVKKSLFQNYYHLKLKN